MKLVASESRMNSSQMVAAEGIEMKKRLAQLQKRANSYFLHVGYSMAPALLPLDVLEVIPFRNGTLKVGDVVLCLPEGKTQPVVHRIFKIKSDGRIRTRGDNNARSDKWLLQRSEIFGHVVAVWRGQNHWKVPNAKTGKLISSFFQSKRIVVRSLSLVFGPPYHFLSHRGGIQPLLPKRLKPRVVSFQNNGKRQLKLMMNRWQVGYYHKKQQKWHIRWPFRLFVDKYTLAMPNQLNF